MTAVHEVLAARDLADLGFSDHTLDDVRDEWRASDVDLGADAQVVEADDGRIVAYAIAGRPGAIAAVIPHYEGQGIGTRLLDWVERRQRGQGRPRHRQWIAGTNARARKLLVDAGYQPERSYWRMVRTLTGESGAAPAPPSGLVFRSVDASRDAAALHELDSISFATNADYVPHTLTTFLEEHLGAHDFDAELSYLAERQGRPVGFLLSRRWEDGVGYVDLLGVHPEYRGRGLGTALLRRAFATFAAAGLREAQLGVASDNPGALRLYERVGMVQRFRYDTYERPIRA